MTVIVDGLAFIDPTSNSQSSMFRATSNNTSLILRNCMFDGFAQPNRVTPQVVLVGPQAPPQAVAQGYTTLVGGAEFDNSTDVTNTLNGSVSAPFYNVDGGVNVVTSYTIANSILTINVDTDSHGTGFQTVNTNLPVAPSRSSPGAHGSPNGAGCEYRYGYFEARMRLNFVNNTGSYYPTFWMYTAESTSSTYMELDIFEMFGGNPFGVMLAWTPGVGNIGPTGFNTANNGWPLNAGNINRSDWNTYGVLWTPTSCQYFVNGVGGNPITMNAAVQFSDNNTHVPNTLMNIATNWMTVIFGSGPSWPVDYDYIRIWQ